MFVRITIDLYIVPLEGKDRGGDPPPQPIPPTRSDILKAVFNAELEVVGGFENCKLNSRDCMIAEQMLDDPYSFLESLYWEDMYLLEGHYEGDILHVLIHWKRGQQPRICRVEPEITSRRVK